MKMNTKRTSTSGTIHHWMCFFECFDLQCSLRMWDMHNCNNSKTIGPSQKRNDSFQVRCHPCEKCKYWSLFFVASFSTKKGHILAFRKIVHVSCKVASLLSPKCLVSLRKPFAYQILGSQVPNQRWTYLMWSLPVWLKKTIGPGNFCDKSSILYWTHRLFSGSISRLVHGTRQFYPYGNTNPKWNVLTLLCCDEYNLHNL